MIFGSLICRWKGHKRGRRVTETTVTFSDPAVTQFQCPRCGAQWTRKVSQRKSKQPKGAVNASNG